MTASNIPFAPKGASTVTFSVTTVSSVQQVNPGPGRSRRLRLVNAGPSTVFVEMGGAGVTANRLSALPILSGGSAVVTAAGSYLAAVTETGSALLYATPGEGG